MIFNWSVPGDSKTFLSPSCRSLNLWKCHLSIPKGHKESAAIWIKTVYRCRPNFWTGHAGTMNEHIFIYLSLFIYMYIFIYLFICTSVFYSANQFFKAGHPSKSAHAQVQGNSSDELSWNFPQMISIFGDPGPVFLNDLFRLVKHPNWILHVTMFVEFFDRHVTALHFLRGWFPYWQLFLYLCETARVQAWHGERERETESCANMHHHASKYVDKIYWLMF